MTIEKQKLLVAVDGSQQSMEAVHYVAGICTPESTEVTLLHVLSPVSETSWDLAGAFEGTGSPMDGERLESRRKVMENFMEGAHRVLSDSGFAADAVRILIQPRREGVARDILHESRHGYLSVVAGKTRNRCRRSSGGFERKRLPNRKGADEAGPAYQQSGRLGGQLLKIIRRQRPVSVPDNRDKRDMTPCTKRSPTRRLAATFAAQDPPTHGFIAMKGTSASVPTARRNWKRCLKGSARTWKIT